MSALQLCLLEGKVTDRVWTPRRFEDISRDALTASGLRLTITRLYLYDLFEQHRDTSLSCDEIIRLLMFAGVPVKPSSVSANVRAFARLGLLEHGAPRERFRVSATYRLSTEKRQDAGRAISLP